jgi:DNA-binding NarL/FixJ family response regulator
MEYMNPSSDEPKHTSNSSGGAQRSPRENSLLRNRPDICEHLTDAQLHVVELLLAGNSAPQISKQLNRSVNTVHDHIKAIYKKLSVNNRVQLVLLFTQPKT